MSCLRQGSEPRITSSARRTAQASSPIRRRAVQTALRSGATDISEKVSVAAEPTLEAGVEGVLERDVDDSLLTSHVGGRGIFATPAMIGLMELCSHRSVEPLLPPGLTTVGFEVSV